MKHKSRVQLEHGHNPDIVTNIKKISVERSRKVGAKTHMSLQGEPECVHTSRKTLNGGSEIGCRPKFWKVL